jgi:CBS domain-containing protein
MMVSMTGQLLVRDIMRIGVPTCKAELRVQAVAQQMIEQNCTALIVLDEDGDSRGWIGERHLAAAYQRAAAAVQDENAGDNPAAVATSGLTAADIMEEMIPECPADIPLGAAVQIMADANVDHLFFLHRAAGQAWPASLVSLRDVVRALAGPEYIRDQGAGAPPPTPMDLFRQRYGTAGANRK